MASWRRNFSAWLNLCEGYLFVTGGVPPNEPVIYSFDGLFVVSLNPLNKESSVDDLKRHATPVPSL